jgi:putative membrane protein
MITEVVAYARLRTVVPGEGGAKTDTGRDEDSAGPAGGAEPDARFTLANERTFLAWSRTALALVVAGLAIVQLLPPFPGVPWGRHLIGTPLILLGSVVAVMSYLEWASNQRALRGGQPMGRSRLPPILAVTITLIGLAAAALALLSGVRQNR